METATFGGGCFWCTEGIFNEIKGVTEVTSGYSGGNMENPSYDDVSSGTTKHAEAIQVKFDPKIISYHDILYIFFKTHDPTTIDKQGHDTGSQYRSIVFYHDEIQKKEVENIITELQKDYISPIVTQIITFDSFYKAEDYHQNYYAKNPEKPYCMLIIDPKIKKLKKDFKAFVK